ncbi:hypothetical protein DID73_01145 [Candidatus Marinamargulisbacteria bacterium SCGC AG-343-K17]|nr:hypothetical protein DID73_01145 [Candidatus Marinamargulisbacteria bacterium SCGC AG-343-K17]
MIKKLWIIVIILGIGFGSFDTIGSNHASESIAGKKNKKKDKIPTEKYLIILNDGHKVKELVGFDVSNNGSGIIKKPMIKRLFGTKHNFKRRKKRLEKKLAKAKNQKRKKRLEKRLKRIEKRIKKHKQMKRDGKFKYKEKVFILKIDKTIPSDTVLLKLKSHPAIKAVSKDQVVKIAGMPNDPYVNDGSGNWAMETTNYANNISPIAIRTNNLDASKFDWYGSAVERLWYLKTIEMDKVWNLDQTVDGDGVIVAVIDSGLRTTHEDINGNIWTNSDEMGGGKDSNGIDDDAFTSKIPNAYINSFTTDYIDDWQGWNYKDNSNNIIDDNGHGAHVIGTIAAVGNNAKGIVGVAPKAKIMVLRTLGGASGTGSSLDTISAIDYAINQGADIINMSLGSGARASVDMSDALNTIRDTLFTEANNLNVILCIAAGNSRAQHSANNYTVPGEIYSSDLTEAYTPAWFSTRHNNIMTVSATTWGESDSSKAYKRVSNSWESNNTFNEYLSNFSNFSSRKANTITVAAPGVQIYSMSHSSDTGYVDKQGTSMATPVVAGLAALVVGINSNLTATEVVDLIKNNTDKPGGTDLANVDYAGAGRINAYKTVMAALNSSISISSPKINTTLYEPSLTIKGKTKENINNLQAYKNNVAIGTPFSSDANGDFSQSLSQLSDGTFPFTVAGEVNGTRVTADAVNVTFDIYKPRISTPSHNETITQPSFKIKGTTEPNKTVQILKRAAGSSDAYALVNSGAANNSGEFDIIIQPADVEFQNSYEFIASASVTVDGVTSQKVSSANTYIFNITSRLINLLSPVNDTKIYKPELRLIGTTASPNVTLQAYYSSDNTATGNTFTSDGSNNYDQVIPFNKDGSYPFKVSGEINGLRTTSNVTNVTFDIYKPIVTLPASGIITTPTFNMIGTTSPNATVEILKRTVGGTYGFVTSKNADAHGTFNILIQPQPEEYNQTLEFIASASVKVGDNITPKQSNISTYNYQIPDYPPTISTPLTDTIIYMPTFSITGTSTKNTLINILENGTISQNTTTDTNGNYTINLTTPFSENKISKTYRASANIYEIPRQSNEIQLHFDLFKPRINLPENSSTITTPTFNIKGTTKPENTVNMFRREQGQSTYEFVASKNSDIHGTFNITIQPTYVDYQKTFEFIASSSITESGLTYNKTSTINTYTLNIKDYPTTISTPTSDTIIYTPTFNLTGTTKAENTVSALENNIITKNGVANVGVEDNGFKSFSLTMTSPKTDTLEAFNYKVTTNIYELPRESNEITLKFDVYKPSIALPLNNTVVATPTFSITGKTEANKNVEIIKGGQIVASTMSDAFGTYNVVVRYDFEGAPSSPQTFTAKATVTTDSGTTIKTSSPKTYTFTVPDIRPKILEPADGTTINAKLFTIRGTTGINTAVELYRDNNPTPTQNSQSDENGEFRFSISPTPGQNNDPTTSANYKVKANVYEKDYFSPTINVSFDVDENAPIIIYPSENATIQSKKITFRGTAKENTHIFIFERAPGSAQQTIIGSCKSNKNGKWSFNYPLKNNRTFYYVAKAKKGNGQSTLLPSNEIKITTKKDRWEPFIESPKDHEEITTATLPVHGTGTANAVVNIYRYTKLNPTHQLLGSTQTNTAGKWSSAFKSPPNSDDYFLTAIITKSGYQGTSNSVAFKMNYNFEQESLSINTPKTNTTTHKKIITVSGQSPNGDLHFYIDDQLKKIIPVSNNKWSTTANLATEKTFKFQAKITHNALEKLSNIVNIIRNSVPKITETSKQIISDNKFKLKGTGKEKTVLTITMIENSLSLSSSAMQTLGSSPKESVIGQVVTDEEGNWILDIPISTPGKYSFKVYENYGTASEVNSQNYSYDITLENNEVTLKVAPSPFNPTKDTLKIEYSFPEESNVDIGIYSISGFKVYGTSIIKNTNGAMSKQRNIFVWDGKSNGTHVAPGLYIVIVKISGEKTVVKAKRVGITW